uniref:Uncharacterized protein n=1 Tax=Triticum urartu TaxID=4572 RepID=A0A8R7UCD8_TRIUA
MEDSVDMNRMLVSRSLCTPFLINCKYWMF